MKSRNKRAANFFTATILIHCSLVALTAPLLAISETCPDVQGASSGTAEFGADRYIGAYTSNNATTRRFRPRNGNYKFIVLHRTAVGTLQSNVSYITTPGSIGAQQSWHYIVGRGGECVVQQVPETSTAFHVSGDNGVNDNSIGIEHVDGGNPNWWKTDIFQFARSARLVRAIAGRRGSGLLERGSFQPEVVGLIGHNDVNKDDDPMNDDDKDAFWTKYIAWINDDYGPSFNLSQARIGGQLISQRVSIPLNSLHYLTVPVSDNVSGVDPDRLRLTIASPSGFVETLNGTIVGSSAKFDFVVREGGRHTFTLLAKDYMANSSGACIIPSGSTSFSGAPSASFGAPSPAGAAPAPSSDVCADKISFEVDNIPPRVISSSPQGDEISLESDIVLTVSEPLDLASISDDSIQINAEGELIGGAVEYADEAKLGADKNGDGDRQDFVLISRPYRDFLPAGKTVTVVVKDAVKDVAGNALDGNGDGYPGANFNWSFRTAIPPPHVAPIVVHAVHDNVDTLLKAQITTFLSNVAEVKAFYRPASQSNSLYTPLNMTLGNFYYEATIPGVGISVNQGLEYFIYARDTAGKSSSFPPGISDPGQYTGVGFKAVVYSEGNNGKMVVGDSDTSNDSVPIRVFLPDAIPSGHRVNFEVYKANRDFSQRLRLAQNVLNAIPGNTPSGFYSFSFDGRSLFPGNYTYSLVERNASDQFVKRLVFGGRLTVVKPLADVQVSIAPGSPNDQVTVNVSGTAQPLVAVTLFGGQSPYRSFSQAGAGPTYSFNVPHAEDGYGAAVYSLVDNEELLIGHSNVVGINPNRAPDILGFFRSGVFTSGHSIPIFAQITDLPKDASAGQVTEATLFFRDSQELAYQSLSMVQTGGNIFTASIPSQPGDNTVQFYIQAKDNENYTSTDPFVDPASFPYSFFVQRDITPPSIDPNSLYPRRGQTGVPVVGVVLGADFSELIDPLTLTTQNIEVKSASGDSVIVSTISYDAIGGRLSCSLGELKPNTLYTATLRGGIKDLSGNGLAGGNFTWTFRTTNLLPPSIRSVSHSPKDFTSSTSEMEFSALISKPVSTVTIVLTNLATNEEIRIKDPLGTPPGQPSPYTYRFTWNGTADGNAIPDGVYKVRLEARDSALGLVANSEFQPINWRVDLLGTVLYNKTNVGVISVSNFDQNISAKFDYSPLDYDRAVVYVNDIEHRIGSKSAAMKGDVVVQGIFAPGRSVIDANFPYHDRTPEVQYQRRYVNQSGNLFYGFSDYKADSVLLGPGQAYGSNFRLEITPSARDPGLSAETGAREDLFGRTDSVHVTESHIQYPAQGMDFDDNPGVESFIGYQQVAANAYDVEFHARNLEPSPEPIIFDVTPPDIALEMSKSIFSPALGQSVALTASFSDNLAFGLKDTSVRVQDAMGGLVKVFHEKSVDVFGTHDFEWDGTDMQGLTVPDGVYVVKLTAKDGVGNPAELERRVRVDTTAPKLEEALLRSVPGLNPLVFMTKDQDIQVSFKLSDNLSEVVESRLAAVREEDEATFVMRSTFTVNAVLRDALVTWNGRDPSGNPVPDGFYSMLIRATDEAGNTVDVPLPRFRIDLTPSRVDTLFADNIFFTPDDGPSGEGDGIGDDVTFTYELAGDAHVVLTLQNAVGQTMLSEERDEAAHAGNTFTWDGKTNMGFAPDGSYVFRLLTIDDVGNEAIDSLAVIKNRIPAQIIFPSSQTSVGGIATIKGIATDPFISDTTGYAEYRLWYRAGEDVDFTLPENDPSSPDPSLWFPIPVPLSYQGPTQAGYPSSYASKRSIVNGVLGDWDTGFLTPGSTYTILLSVKDQAERVSFDRRQVVIDPAADDTVPSVSFTNIPASEPPLDVSLQSPGERVQISYALSQSADKRAEVALELFRIRPDSSVGHVLFVQSYSLQAAGRIVHWDARDPLGNLVENGRYRIRLTARDLDGSGVGVTEADINLNLLFTEPVRIENFAPSQSIVSEGQTALVSYRLNKTAHVSVNAFDMAGQSVAVYEATKSSDTILWSTALSGLYRWEILAVSLEEPQTRATASFPLTVTSTGSGTATPAIIGTKPEAVGGAVQGLSEFNWLARASGEYYPPQDFSVKVNAIGEQRLFSVISTGSFSPALQSNVTFGSGGMTLAQYYEPHFVFVREVRRYEMELTKYHLDCKAPPRGTCSDDGSVSWDKPVVDLNSLRATGSGTLFGGIDISWRQATSIGLHFRSGENKSNISNKTATADGSIHGVVEDDNSHWVGSNVYYDSGEIISDTFSYDPILIPGVVNWNASLPSATLVKFQLATSPDGLSFNFVGPDGTPNTFYTSPGQALWQGHAGDSFIRWRAVLSTSDRTVTPILYNVEIKSQWAPQTTISGTSWFNHPFRSQDLNGLLPVPEGKSIVRLLPFYSVVQQTLNNQNIAPSIVQDGAAYRLRAASLAREPWSSQLDQGLAGGRFGRKGVEFNNDPNHLNFTLEAPFIFGTNRVEPITLSTAYPNVNMLVEPSIKNKYTFWDDGYGNKVDNPYVAVDARAGGWNIELAYPDGTPNDSLVVRQDLAKVSNNNLDPDTEGTPLDIDDDFTIRLATGTAPRSFVEIKGNTSGPADNFQSYAMFYKKADEPLFHAIPVQAATVPVTDGGTLAHWDVTGLMGGDYDVKLMVFSGGGINEAVRRVTIGTLVPGYQTASGTVTVRAPYNKAYLEFPPDALARDTLVTITPLKLNDTKLSFNPDMPPPIGAVYDLQPKDIEFVKDASGTVAHPASLTVRFSPEELAGISSGQLTLYNLSEEGVLQALDARVVVEDGTNITKVISPITHFSYLLTLSTVVPPVVDAYPSLTSQARVTITGRSDPAAFLDIFNNSALIGQTTAQADGHFEAEIPLSEGNNFITAQAKLYFGIEQHRFERTSALSTPILITLDTQKPSIKGLTVSAPAFSPYEGGVSTVTLSVSESCLGSLHVETGGGSTQTVRVLMTDRALGAGKTTVTWDGKDSQGDRVPVGKYVYVFKIKDLAENPGGEARIEIAVDGKAPEVFLSADKPLFRIDGGTFTFKGSQFALSALDLAGEKVLFEDDFSVPSQEFIFSSFGGTFTGFYRFIDGVFELGSGSVDDAAVALLNKTFPHDRIVEVNVKTLSSSAQSRSWNVGWVDAVRNPANGLQRMYALIHTNGDVELSLINGESRKRWDVETDLSPFDAHTFRYVIQGNNLKLSIDGLTYFDVTDELVGEIQGTVGFEANGQTTARYDDLRVWEFLPGGGVKRVELSFDGGLFQTYTSPVVLNSEGMHTLRYRALDLFGSLGATKRLDVIVDNTPPQSAIGMSPSMVDGYVRLPGRPDIVSVDGGALPAGVKTVEARRTGQLWRPMSSADLDFNEEGAYTLLARGFDRAENREEAKSLSFRVDGTPPESTLTTNLPFFVSGNEQFGSPALAFQLSAADPILRAPAFRSRFDRPKEDWKVLYGQWAAEPVVGSTAAGHALVGQDGRILLDGDWRDFTFEAKLKTLEAGPNPWEVGGFLLRYQDAGNYYWLILKYDGILELAKRKNFQASNIIYQPYSVNVYEENIVKVVVTGPRFQIFINGTLAADVVDTDPGYLSQGGVALQSFFARAAYDDVKVTPTDQSSETFEDRFEGLEEWQVASGAWQITHENRLQGAGGRIRTTGAYPTDRTVSGKIRTASPGPEPWDTGWLFPKFEDADNSLGLILNQTGHLEVTLRKSGQTARWDASTGLSPATEHHFKAVFSGARLQILIDGASHLDVSDPRLAEIAGGVALQAEDSTALFDDIAVSVPSDLPGSGMGEILVSLDGGPEAAFTGPVSVSTAGPHVLSYRSRDRAGNLEDSKQVQFTVDNQPPATQVITAPFYMNGADRFAPLSQGYSLRSEDSDIFQELFADEFATGLNQWQTDSGVWSAGEGFVQNTEPGRIRSLRQDLPADRTVTARVKTLQAGAEPWQAAYVFPKYEDFDNSIALILHKTGNLEVNIRKAGVIARHDVMTPLSPLDEHVFKAVVQGSRLRVSLDGTEYVNVEEPAVGQLAGGVALQGEASLIQASQVRAEGGLLARATGLRQILARMDQGSEFVFQSTVTFGSEGAHELFYRAEDNVGNAEEEKVLRVLVDGTSPQTQAVYTGAHRTVGTKTFISSQTLVSFSAQDPLSNGVAAGVREIRYSVSGGPYAAVSSTQSLTFSEGVYQLDYYAVDNVGHSEAVKSVQLAVEIPADSQPPRTALAAGQPRFGSDPMYISHSTTFTLTGVDDLRAANDESGVGISRSFLAVDSEPFRVFDATEVFALPEGVRAVSFYSEDYAGNQELPRSATFYVDASPPVSNLDIGEPKVAEASGVVVGPVTSFTLSSLDPEANGVSSGLAEVFFRAVPAEPFQVYGSSFVLTGSEGARTVGFYGRDRVLNTELLRSTAVVFDATPPVTRLVLAGPNNAVEDITYISTGTVISFEALDSTTSDLAAGVEYIQARVDGADFRIMAATETFTLTSGRHTVEFFSADRVKNQEPVQSQVLIAGDAPPEVFLAASAPPFFVEGSTFVLRGTGFGLSAQGLSKRDLILEETFSNQDQSAWVISREGGAGFTSGTLEILPDNSVSFNGTPARDRIFEATVETLDPGQATESWNVGWIDLLRGASARVYLLLHAGGNLELNVFDGSAGARYDVQTDLSPFDPHRFRAVLLGGRLRISIDGLTYLDVADGRIAGIQGTFGFEANGPATVRVDDVRLWEIAEGPDIERIEVSLNEGVFQTYTSSVVFATGGEYFLAYRAVDRLGNQGETGRFNAVLDDAPPVSSIAATPSLSNGFALPGLTAAVASADVGASGLRAVEFKKNGQLWRSLESGSFLFAHEGRYSLEARATDRADNREAAKSLAFGIDGTAPETTFASEPPVFLRDGETFISSRHALTLTATDTPLKTQLLMDSFEIPRGDWRVISGDWTLQTSGLPGAPGNVYAGRGGRALLTEDWQDFELEAKVRTSAPGGSPWEVGGLLFRYKDTGNYYWLLLKQDGFLELTRKKDFRSVALFHERVSINPLEEYTVKVRAAGPRFEIFLNGGLAADVTDPDPAFLAQGGVALEALYSEALFDGVKVVPLSGAGSGFQDHFDIFGVWQVEFGNWRTTPDHKLKGIFGRLKTAGSYPADRVVSAKIRATSPGPEAWQTGWIFPKYETLDDSLGLMLHQTGNLEVNLRRNGQTTRWDAATGLSPAVEHEFKALFSGPRLKVFIDGIQYLDLADPKLAEIAGGVALQAENATALFDDVAVSVPGDLPGSGVEQTLVSLDGSPEAIFTGSISVSTAGAHTLAYRSRDRLGNLEEPKQMQFTVDNQAPATELVTEPFYINGPDRYAPLGRVYAFRSTDPDVGSKVFGDDFTTDLSQWQTDYGVWTVEGGHGRNTEPGRMRSQRQDLPADRMVTARVKTLQAGPEVWQAAYVFPKYEDFDNSIALILHQTGNLEVSIRKAGVVTRRDAMTALSPLEEHVFEADIKGSRLKVSIDGTEYVSVEEPVVGQLAGGVALQGENSLIQVDDIQVQGGAIARASGVKQVLARVDGGPGFTAASTVTFSTEGAHELFYQAEDNVGNVEEEKSLRVFVDGTAPQTQVVYTGTHTVAGTKTFISSQTLVSLIAMDPVSEGVASGLAGTELRLDGGDFQAYASSFTLTQGLHVIEYRSRDNTGNLETLNRLEVAVDAGAPETSLVFRGPAFSVPSETVTYISEGTSVELSVADVDSSTAATFTTRFAIDSDALTDYTSGFFLVPGTHTVTFFSVDSMGNQEETKVRNLWVDASTPTSSLVLEGPHVLRPDAPALVGPQTLFLISPEDPPANGVAAGISNSFYRVEDSTEAAFTLYGPEGFQLTGPSGPTTIQFFSEDRVGNRESTRLEPVELDSTSPDVFLAVPSPTPTGLEYVFTPGTMTIIGSVADDHFSGYTLSFATASGKDMPAAGPFTDILASTGTDAGGILGAWDTRSLSGWYTVRLSAQDAVGNESVLQANVFLGAPERVLSLGAGETVDFALTSPEGLVLDSAGNIYVGEPGRIRKFDPAGNLLATLGESLSMGQVAGLALDPVGSLYVADRSMNQFLKLNPDGSLVFALAKRGSEGEPLPGTEPGEFNGPAGVALDATGNIYVADRENGRVQKISSSGQILNVFDLNVLAPTASTGTSRPWGVAFDAEGTLWVSDEGHDRLINLTTSGNFVLELDENEAGPTPLQGPRGLALSPNGYIFVADSGNSRTTRLPGLSFGDGSLFASPAGLALDGAGRLYVTDRERQVLQVFDVSGPASSSSNPPQAAVSVLKGITVDPAFRLGDVYCYPNPAKRKNPTLHVEVGMADRVEVRIYDLAGGLVHQAQLTGAPAVIDDGQGPQYAYEYTWDVSRAASGVYVYVIQAKKDGHEDIRKTSKLAVIK